MDQRLIEQHMLFAKKLAISKKKNLPFHIDVEELISAAYLGLVQAASRYNPSFDNSFTTFSYPRICGAINDYLRSLRSINISLDSNESQNSAERVAAKEEKTSGEIFEFLTYRLDKDAQDMLKMYFMDGISMAQIGLKLGVSESRVSQLISKYKFKMQKYKNEAMELLAA